MYFSISAKYVTSTYLFLIWAMTLREIEKLLERAYDPLDHP